MYADDAVVDLITDGVHERYVLAVGDGVVVNSWTGSLDGSDDARGLDIWHFDAAGRVREHQLYTFLSVRPSTHPLARLRFALTSPVTALTFFREQRRFGVKPAPAGGRR